MSKQIIIQEINDNSFPIESITFYQNDKHLINFDISFKDGSRLNKFQSIFLDRLLNFTNTFNKNNTLLSENMISKINNLNFDPKSVDDLMRINAGNEIASLSANSPKKIKKINNFSVQDENGKIHKIGLKNYVSDTTFFQFKKVTKQEFYNFIVEEAKNFVNLKHIKYLSIAEGSLKLPEKYFEPKELVHYKVKSPESFADGILEIFNNTENEVKIECCLAQELIRFKALLTAFIKEYGIENGKKIFNKVCNEKLNYTLPRNVKKISSSAYNGDFLTIENKNKKINFVNFNEILTPGQTLVISNISSYTYRHPHGFAQNFNVIYVGMVETIVNGQKVKRPMFSSLFDDYKLHTYEEIIDILINEYNAEPDLAVTNYDIIKNKEAKKEDIKRFDITFERYNNSLTDCIQSYYNKLNEKSESKRADVLNISQENSSEEISL